MGHLETEKSGWRLCSNPTSVGREKAIGDTRLVAEKQENTSIVFVDTRLSFGVAMVRVTQEIRATSTAAEHPHNAQQQQARHLSFLATGNIII